MSQVESKKAAALEALKLVENGNVLGLGTGSTSEEMIKALGQKIGPGFAVTGVPTSQVIADQARAAGVTLIDTLPDFGHIDLTLDGADEVDPKGNLVKGGGGALLREKLVAAASRRLIIMVDESKHVEKLCSTRPLPVEIIAYGWTSILERLRRAGAQPVLRMKGDQAFVTDHGNYIADCGFEPCDDPEELQLRLIAIPGVVETGLFIAMASTVVTGREDGSASSRSFMPVAPLYGRA